MQFFIYITDSHLGSYYIYHFYHYAHIIYLQTQFHGHLLMPASELFKII
jgi:hypothetical protein